MTATQPSSFSIAKELSGGTAYTAQCARRLNKPLLHIAAAEACVRPEAAKRLRQFASEHRVQVLNVAGPRESEEPGVGAFAREVLELAFAPKPEPG